MLWKRQTVRRGFTLLEAALTTMIVGIGLVATIQLLASGTTANIDGARTTTAVNLAKGIRELSLKMTFDEVGALHGQTYNPPVDSRGSVISGFNMWSQTITVQPVDPDRLTTDIVTEEPDAVRVTVLVSQHGNKVNELSWYRFRPTP